ncbi:MAG: 2,3-bisphosphoglycerate-independent phosphoglycerate mutase [Gammaproteobacteria bacterium]
MTNRPRPVALLILDGFGHREDTDGNAIAAARKPHWARLCAAGTRSLIETSGIDVGLPHGQMGNSEVGHLNLGAGRVVYQDYTRISAAIEDGSLSDNAVLLAAMDGCARDNTTLHLLGLLSPGGVHSHEEHLFALVRMAKARGVSKLVVHAILDGRDMPPKSAAPSLQRLQAVFDECELGRVGSLCGRFYAMDRDNRWDRVSAAYQLYVDGTTEHQFENAGDALDAAYARDETDEFVVPTAVGDEAVVADNDAVIFWNYRADRAREMTRAFIEPDFDGFSPRRFVKLRHFVCMTQYQADFDAPVAYGPNELPNTLGAVVSGLGLKQLRIAETEKYAHVTFFFNGGEETPFAGEERILVPSPDVRTYDLQPEMNAPALTDKLVAAIEGGEFDLIICNYANADMVGHTGNFDAAVKAIEALDTCVGRVADAILAAGGAFLLTADHGNAEQMSDAHSGQAHTAHTTNPVPLLLYGMDGELSDGGVLSDIAPTLLAMMGLEQPDDMTGRSLLC